MSARRRHGFLVVADRNPDAEVKCGGFSAASSALFLCPTGPGNHSTSECATFHLLHLLHLLPSTSSTSSPPSPSDHGSISGCLFLFLLVFPVFSIIFIPSKSVRSFLKRMLASHYALVSLLSVRSKDGLKPLRLSHCAHVRCLLARLCEPHVPRDCRRGWPLVSKTGFGGKT